MVQSVPSWHVVPDSAWCWLVGIGNVVVAFCTIGIYRCFGVFYPAIMDSFGVQYAQLSLVSGFYTGSMSFGALLLVLVKKYGCRRVGMISCLAVSLSLFAASVSSSVWMFILFCGATAGFFSGIVFNLMCLTCALYFDKHRSKAAVTASAGSSVGILLAAPAIDALINSYGWRGAMLIMSAISFHACASMSLYRPIACPKDENIEDLQFKCEDGEIKKTRGLRSVFDYTLFQRPMYILVYLSSMTFWPSMAGSVFLLVPFGMETLGIDRTQASILITVHSAGEILAKLTSGPVADHKSVNRAMMLFITTLTSAFSMLGMAFCKTYLSCSIFAFLQGFFCAPYSGLYVVLYSDVFGLEKMTSAISYEGFLSTLFTLPVTYLLGIAIDATGDVKVPYYICAGFSFVCSISILLIYLLKRPRTA